MNWQLAYVLLLALQVIEQAGLIFVFLFFLLKNNKECSE